MQDLKIAFRQLLKNPGFTVHPPQRCLPERIQFRRDCRPSMVRPLRTGYGGRAVVALTLALGAGSWEARGAQSVAATNSFLGAKAGEETTISGVRICWCPPGKFMMGSPRNEPERRPGEDQVEVTLTKDFWMAKFEATQGDWKRVMGQLPGPLTAELPEGDDYPVGNVNFAEAEAFCRKLGELAHRSGELPEDWVFRLPTEAQWEYACRAGTTTATSFGDRLSSKQANFKGKPYNGAEPGPSLGHAAKVGSYPANPWGLHDMHGNIYEWCRDWYHQRLPGGIDPDLYAAKDTATRSEHGDISRSRRGGCWADEGWPLRTAFRLRFEPERRYDHIGFRVALVKSPAPEGVATVSNASARPFRMGFTGFPPDITAEAVSQTRQFVRTNADLIAHHIEGVPWAEALRGQPFPKPLADEYETKRSMKPPGAKVYLAISPGRGDLKLAEKGTTPLPPELRGKSYDDPLVVKAYLNYCRRSIKFFQPDFLAIGIEVNEIFSAGKDRWSAYAELHRQVYRELKREHPDLPIFASYTLHNLIKTRGEMLKASQELMPFNDFVAISFYPFFITETPDDAFKWLTENFDPFGKPYAMVETNEAAERLQLPRSGFVLNGTPEKQTAYVRTLLALADQHRFRFVVLFIHQDYDALWDAIKATAPELFMAWRDCGLVDERGRPRPAYFVWRDYLSRPLTPEAKQP